MTESIDTRDPAPMALAVTSGQHDHVFPTLSPAQLSRIGTHGRRRSTSRGEVLVEVGDRAVPVFVVISGELQAVRPTDRAETLIVSHRAGQFSGEANIIAGRRALGRLRVSEPGEVIELAREQLRAVIQTDAELSEILMRAFILRRLELIAHDLGDVVVIGSAHSAGTLRVKEFLTRNGHPFHYVDLDRDRDAQDLLDRFRVGVADIPVVICRGSAALRNPTNAQVADCLGLNEGIDQARVVDGMQRILQQANYVHIDHKDVAQVLTRVQEHEHHDDRPGPDLELRIVPLSPSVIEGQRRPDGDTRDRQGEEELLPPDEALGERLVPRKSGGAGHYRGGPVVFR